MPRSFYDTETLLGIIDNLVAPSKAIANTFLGSTFFFDTEYVEFDKVIKNRKVAAYTSSTVAGRATRVRSEKIEQFKPGYVKPKHIIDPSRMIKRRAGERLSGALTPGDRRDLVIADILREQDEMITRREELMAIEALRTGKVIVESEDFPKMEIDFARDAGQTVALTGGSRWGESGVRILDALKGWAETVQKASGAHPYKVILDPLAAGLLTTDTELRAILDNLRQASGVIELAGVAVGGLGNEFRRLGQIGDFEFWVYQQYYVDASGTVQKMMPDYTCIMGNPELAEGSQAYGAIMDLSALFAGARFPKMWDEKDPSVEFLMTQSAPLPLIGRIESTFCATVR